MVVEICRKLLLLRALVLWANMPSQGEDRSIGSGGKSPYPVSCVVGLALAIVDETGDYQTF